MEADNWQYKKKLLFFNQTLHAPRRCQFRQVGLGKGVFSTCYRSSCTIISSSGEGSFVLK